MIAIEISSFGSPEVLKPVERPKPKAQRNEVVIRIHAAGVARADTLQRQGKYPPPPGASDIPGLDAAGVIDSVGESVTSFKTGDRVCAILSGGGYAEFCAVPAVQVLPVPENWSEIEAATLPENLFTVYDNMVTRAGLHPGENVLIHGGTSGIGSMAIMLAKARNASVIATAGTDEKCDACLQLGADHAINYKTADFAAEAKRITNGNGVDVVVDIVGGPYIERDLDALALEGRISVIATQGGRTAQVDLGKLMMRRGRILGSTMRARTPEQKGLVAQAVFREVWPLLPPKDPIRPLIDCTLPLTEASQAHARLEGGTHIGKIVLVTDAA